MFLYISVCFCVFLYVSVFLYICLYLQTYIGTLLVSLNPYKELDIYNAKQMDLYMGVSFFELPPHM